MLTAAARTHAGRVRPLNEDALVCRPEDGLFAVVDGMGGEEAGEVAAAIAAAVLAETPAIRRARSDELLARGFERARERILAEQRADPRHGQMGAVATALRFDDDGRTVGVAHLGDTRAYRVGPGGVERLTEDHVAAEPAPGGGKRPVARDLGRKDLPPGSVDRRRVKVAHGDLLVLCSDGLYDPLGDEALAEELRRLHAERAEPDAAAARLVALALARGGPDNVTVVVVRVGRFRRGRLARMGWTGTLVSLAVLGALALGIGFYRGRTTDGTLPTRVTGVRVLPARDAWTLPSAGRFEVAPGATAVIRGSRVEGQDWSVAVGPGGVLTIDRAVVRLDGAWVIDLAAGAQLLVRDTRVEVGALSLARAADAVAAFEHVGVHAGSGWPLPDAGLRLLDVRALDATGAPLPAPEPPPPPAPAPEPPGAPR